MMRKPDRPLRSLGANGELATEHAALLRRLALLQHRVTEQLQTSQRQQLALETENIRLRGELLRMRTAVFWQLRPTAPMPRTPNRMNRPIAPVPHELHEAQSVICQTGCVGHAHPWLGNDGECRRTGQLCDRQVEEALPEAKAAPGGPPG